MSSAMYQSMRSNPKFQQLVAKRGRYAWTLSAVVLTVFYGYVLLVAFKWSVLPQPLLEGGFLSVGVALGLLMFVSFWILTALYVRRANTEFDALTAEIIKEAQKENK
jgi:cation/acetate symporter